MRSLPALVLRLLALLLMAPSGCVHLPPQVAAAVQQPDPAPLNHFLRKTSPVQTATNGDAAAR